MLMHRAAEIKLASNYSMHASSYIFGMHEGFQLH